MQPKRLFTRHSHLLETSEIETEAHQVFVDDGEPLIDFARYYRILRKRQRIVIAFAVTVIIIAVVHIISTRPVFTAETTIMLSPATGESSSTLANLVEIETAA